MQMVHPRGAGLDVHKKSVVVGVRLVAADATSPTHTRTFGTTKEKAHPPETAFSLKVQKKFKIFAGEISKKAKAVCADIPDVIWHRQR